MAWAKNGTPSTLGVAGDNLNISDLVAKKFNQFLMNGLGDAAGVWNSGNNITFNNNINSVYAVRYNVNGSGDATVVSQPNIYTRGNRDYEFFEVSYVISILGQEKLMILFHVDSSNSGAGAVPVRSEIVGKFVPNPDADITRIDYEESDEDGATLYNVGTNLSAIGTNGDEVLYKIQNGTVFEETDTNKSFIFNSSTGAWTQF